MSLQLDPRQRAMLQEMGVRVWQPEQNVGPAGPVGLDISAISASPVSQPSDAVGGGLPVAIKSGAVSARPQRAAAIKDADSTAVQARHEHATPALPVLSGHRPVAPPLPALAPSGSPVWQIGAEHTLYGNTHTASVKKTSPAHWLVLAETPAASLQAGDFDPLAGEVGALLGNMLRAARLPAAAQVQFVPLARLLPSSPDQAGLAEALAPLLARIQPDMVLLMGRLAAQAALQTGEPFGQLRGRIHRLHGIATVLTFDAAHLLRNADNKAKAWDDLCLAMGFVEERGWAARV